MGVFVERNVGICRGESGKYGGWFWVFCVVLLVHGAFFEVKSK